VRDMEVFTFFSLPRLTVSAELKMSACFSEDQNCVASEAKDVSSESCDNDSCDNDKEREFHFRFWVGAWKCLVL